jgi:hypothetical protein
MIRPADELRRLKWQWRVAGLRRAKDSARTAASVPVVFGNAMAKSGSHVLSQFLQGLAAITPLVFTDLHPVRTQLPGEGARPVTDVLRDLRRLRRGDIAWGYLPSQTEYLDVFRAQDSLVMFIYRDPRDKIISQIHYATGIHKTHGLRQAYLALPSMEARIDAAIRGVPGLSKGIADIYRSYEAWLQHPATLPIRFEDMILDRRAAVGGILARVRECGVPLFVEEDEAQKVLDEAMAPRRSPTFRSGQPGEWRQAFTPANVITFQQLAGDLLAKWGYAVS